MGKFFLFFLTLGLLFWSCTPDFGKPKWNVGTKIPIVSTKISFDKIIRGNEFFKGADTGNIAYIKYKQNLVTLKLDTLFRLPDTTSVETFTIPVGPLNFAPGQILQNDTINTKYRLSGVELHETKFRTGKMILEIFSNIEEEIEIQYLIPESFKNGEQFKFTTYAPAGTFANPTIFRDTFDLADFTMDLRGQRKNNFNTVTAMFMTRISPNGNIVVLNQGNYLTINTTIVDAVPEYVKGYFKNQTFKVERQSSDADVFSIFKSGNLTFSKPEISLFVQNQVGVDFAANEFNISGENTQSGIEVELQSSVLNNLRVSRAFLNPNQDPPYRSNNINLSINAQNSNLSDVLANLPNKIWYDAELQVNPLGNISGYNDFIYYNSGIALGLEVLLPMQFSSINNLMMVDTADFVFTAEPGYESIQNGFLQMIVNNHFDFSIKPGIKVLDENDNYIFTLLAPEVTVPKVSEQTIPIRVNQAILQMMYAGSKMVIELTIDNPENSALEAYVKDEVEITLVTDFDYLVNIK